MGTVEEEADETMYWMELILEAVRMSEKQIFDLCCEANDILAMIVSSIKTARKHA